MKINKYITAEIVHLAEDEIQGLLHPAQVDFYLFIYIYRGTR
jgi:hypothetical protein